MTALPKPAAHIYAVEIEEEVAAKLRGVAEERGTSVEDLIASVAHEYAVQERTTYDNWSDEDIAAIEKGIAQLRGGQKVRQEDMMARLKAKYAG
ncbi:hypothetical protein [uncultured Brevundimonas sp.]|uniref:hypothetical protein n=1 Tax=uncultured Brevundimonas sp. TaxID=213418 RepID=UPI00260323F9|nr:hypothetical protein [uncultured Brevundimonas sp.]